MSGHRLESSLRGFIDLVTQIPWWVSLLCAIAAHAALSPLADLRIPVGDGTYDTAVVAVIELAVATARFGQYALPLLLVALAVISLSAMLRRLLLLTAIVNDTTGTSLKRLGEADLRLVVLNTLRYHGFEPRHLDDAPPELEMTRGGIKYLVDLRYWRLARADAQIIRESANRLPAANARCGILVVSGRFSAEATKIARPLRITTIDGRRLKELILTRHEGISSFNRFDAQRLAQSLGIIIQRTGRGLRAAYSAVHASVSDAMQALARRERAAVTPSAPSGESAHDENRIAEELTALVRAENRAVPTRARGRSRPVRQKRKQPTGLGKKIRLSVSRPWRLLARLLDTAGVIAAMAAIWMIYQWFFVLPADAAATPWSRMGSARSSEVVVGVLATEADLLHGLGIVDFGAARTEAAPGPAPVESIEPVLAEPEPEEPIYHSVRELDAAFERTYRAPPGCSAPHSTARMVECGNHRMRARRNFIASDGRTMEGAPAKVIASGRVDTTASEPITSDDAVEPAPIPVFSGDEGQPADGVETAPTGLGSWWDNQVERRRESDSEPQPDWRREWMEMQIPAEEDWRQEWLQRDGSNREWRGGWRDES